MPADLHHQQQQAVDLAAVADLAVAGEDLLDERGSGARQAGDEGRPPGRLGLRAGERGDALGAVALDRLRAVPAIGLDAVRRQRLDLACPACERGDRQGMIAPVRMGLAQGVVVGRPVSRRGGGHVSSGGDDAVGEGGLAREIERGRERDPRHAQFRPQLRHALERLARLVELAELERADAAGVGVGGRLRHGFGQGAQQVVSRGRCAALFEHPDLAELRRRRSAVDLDEAIDRLAGESELAVLEREVGQLLPLIAHRRVQREQLTDDRDLLRPIARLHRRLQLIEQPERGGRIGVASAGGRWWFGHSSWPVTNDR
jgi:hypothetical protein